MAFLGLPAWGRHVNGTHKSVANKWDVLALPREVRGPLVPPPAPRPRASRLHVLLFLITVVTTLVAGMYWAGIAHPLRHPELLYHGIPFAATLLTILFCHEMGHYLTARYYGMDVTFPYFIPSPPFIQDTPFLGTFGAVIRMQSPPQHRRALLHVGAAGPIAGFCVAVPAMIYALATAIPVPTAQTQSLELASPLFVRGLEYLILGPTPKGMTLTIDGVGVAAWFGLLVTVLNLLPIGQLDGGHIVYALLGRQARYVYWAMIGALLVLGVVAWPGWILWAFLGWLSGRQQPVVLDERDPLSRTSWVIAAIALVIFIVCFMPVPMQ